jgi:hypothetical protein
MIGIKTMGGLGNLMFQIATGETWRERGYNVVYTNIDENLSFIASNYAFRRHSYVYKSLWRGFDWDKHKAPQNASFKPARTPFIYVDITPVDRVEYIGYFQSDKHFPSRELVMKLFEPSDWLVGHICFPWRGEITCSIHVRRQDYLGLQDYHPVLDMDYYNRAIETLSPFNVNTFLVFSDDIKWCRENFKGDKFVFMQSVEHVAIYQMAKCNHNIMANSSLSWWGSYLGGNDNRVVIAPEKWFGVKGENPKDVYNEHWIKL